MGVTYINPYRFGVPFSPLDLSPALWLDASDAATITSSGGKVSQWSNKGSLGAFTQSTSTVQPVTGADTLNGLNVITFTADYMTSSNAASAYKAFSDGTDYIFAAVLKVGASSNPDAAYGILDSCAASFSYVGMSIFYDDRSAVPRNDVVAHFVGRGVSNTVTVANLSADNAMSPNSWHVLSIYADPDNASPTSRSRMTVDAGSAIANNVGTLAPSTSNPTYPMVLGSINTLLATFALTGMIGEMLLISGANATEANRQVVAAYLKSKWGL